MKPLDELPRVLTRHAIGRYRSRIDRAANILGVQAALDAGVLRPNAPPGVITAQPVGQTHAWIVAGAAVFPMRRQCGDLVAITCLKRHLRSKADRRAYREQRRDGDLAA